MKDKISMEEREGETFARVETLCRAASEVFGTDKLNVQIVLSSVPDYEGHVVHKCTIYHRHNPIFVGVGFTPEEAVEDHFKIKKPFNPDSPCPSLGEEFYQKMAVGSIFMNLT